MTKIISFANQKGGVGKSTLCIQMVYYLQEQGKRVLVIDMDPQGNTSSRVAARTIDEDGQAHYHYTGTRSAQLFEHEPIQIEVMRCTETRDLIHTPRNDPQLADIEREPITIVAQPAKQLEGFVDKYDYVLIDCPPNFSQKLVGALAASTHVVCPVKLSGFGIDGVEDIVQTIIGVQKTFNPKLNFTGLIINDMDRSLSHERALKQVGEALKDLVFENKIMHRPPLDSATNLGVPVWSLGYGHVAAKEVVAVLEEILKKVA